MKHAKELKIGIFVIVILVASFFLINYLRGEDIFNNEGTAYKSGNVHTNQSDDWQQTVFQYMTEQKNCFIGTFGNSSHNIVFFQLRDGIGSDVFGINCCMVQTEYTSRHDQMPDEVAQTILTQGLHTTGWEPVKFNCKDNNTDHCDPEWRNRNAGINDCTDNLINRFVFI